MQEIENHMSVFGLSSGHAMQEHHKASIAHKYKTNMFPKVARTKMQPQEIFFGIETKDRSSCDKYPYLDH
jgi:hypothetical protein